MEDFEAEFTVEPREDFNFVFEFNIESTEVDWGHITGTLDDQTDLADALDTLDSQIASNHQEITNIHNTIEGYGDIISYNAADFATKNQGLLAESALQPNDNISLLNNNAGYITNSALNGYATQQWTIEQASALATDLQTWVTNQGYTSNVGTVTSVNNTQPDANGNVTIQTGGTIDQTFDGTSANAQSGIAIEGKLADYVKGQNGNITISNNGTEATIMYVYEEEGTPQQGYVMSLGDTSSGEGIVFVSADMVEQKGYLVGMVPDGLGITDMVANQSALLTVSNNNLAVNGNEVQTKLVSGTNIKTINNISLLGSGNIDIQGGGGSTWGSITGTLSNQTDLQDALDEKQDVLTAGGNINIGANWTKMILTNLNEDGGWLAYGNGKFVLINVDGVCFTSTDGVTWSETVTLNIPSGLSVENLQIRYGNGKFVLVYYDSSEENAKVMTSSDGVTWTQPALINNNIWEGFLLVFDGTNFVVFGGNYFVEEEVGMYIKTTSADGITWTAPVEINLEGLSEYCEYINGVYVQYDGWVAISSTDGGITWTQPVAIAPEHYGTVGGLMTDGTSFICFVTNTDNIYTVTSTDGVNWSAPVEATALNNDNFDVFTTTVKDGKCFAFGGIWDANLQQQINYITTFESNSLIISTTNCANTDLSNLSAKGESVIDGMWSSENRQLISSSTSLNGTTPLTFTPITDGNNYVVLLRCIARTGTTNGDSFRVEVSSDRTRQPVYLCGATTRTDSYQEVAGSCILPLSTSGKLYVNRSASFNGEIQELTIVARRRMGTNS